MEESEIIDILNSPNYGVLIKSEEEFANVQSIHTHLRVGETWSLPVVCTFDGDYFRHEYSRPGLTIWSYLEWNKLMRPNRPFTTVYTKGPKDVISNGQKYAVKINSLYELYLVRQCQKVYSDGVGLFDPTKTCLVDLTTTNVVSQTIKQIITFDDYWKCIGFLFKLKFNVEYSFGDVSFISKGICKFIGDKNVCEKIHVMHNGEVIVVKDVWYTAKLDSVFDVVVVNLDEKVVSAIQAHDLASSSVMEVPKPEAAPTNVLGKVNPVTNFLIETSCAEEIAVLEIYFNATNDKLKTTNLLFNRSKLKFHFKEFGEYLPRDLKLYTFDEWIRSTFPTGPMRIGIKYIWKDSMVEFIDISTHIKGNLWRSGKAKVSLGDSTVMYLNEFEYEVRIGTFSRSIVKVNWQFDQSVQMLYVSTKDTDDDSSFSKADSVLSLSMQTPTLNSQIKGDSVKDTHESVRYNDPLDGVAIHNACKDSTATTDCGEIQFRDIPDHSDLQIQPSCVTEDSNILTVSDNIPYSQCIGSNAVMTEKSEYRSIKEIDIEEISFSRK